MIIFLKLLLTLMASRRATDFDLLHPDSSLVGRKQITHQGSKINSNILVTFKENSQFMTIELKFCINNCHTLSQIRIFEQLLTAQGGGAELVLPL
jgi:hypothetical protein